MAVLEFICGGMFDKVYSGLVGIAVECGIENGLKSCGCGRHDCWKHQWCMNVGGKEPEGAIFVRYKEDMACVPTLYSILGTGCGIDLRPRALPALLRPTPTLTEKASDSRSCLLHSQ